MLLNSASKNSSVSGFLELKWRSANPIQDCRPRHHFLGRTQLSHSESRRQLTISAGCKELEPDHHDDGFFEDIPQVFGDWRHFRAQLFQKEKDEAAANGQVMVRPKHRMAKGSKGQGQWAHPLVKAEQGCLLLARAHHMSFFSRTVIFIVDHGDQQGSWGLILNLAGHQPLSDIGLCPKLAGAFRNQRAMVGGPVYVDHIHALHRCPEVPGATKVIEGIYQGGLMEAYPLVQAGKVKPESFGLYVGYAGWDAGVLNTEIAKGQWWVVAASNEVALESFPKSVKNIEKARDMMWNKILNLAGIYPGPADDGI